MNDISQYDKNNNDDHYNDNNMTLDCFAVLARFAEGRTPRRLSAFTEVQRAADTDTVENNNAKIQCRGIPCEEIISISLIYRILLPHRNDKNSATISILKCFLYMMYGGYPSEDLQVMSPIYSTNRSATRIPTYLSASLISVAFNYRQQEKPLVSKNSPLIETCINHNNNRTI